MAGSFVLWEGSEERASHDFEMHLKRRKDLAGSMDSISTTISLGSLVAGHCFLGESILFLVMFFGLFFLFFPSPSPWQRRMGEAELYKEEGEGNEIRRFYGPTRMHHAPADSGLRIAEKIRMALLRR